MSQTQRSQTNGSNSKDNSALTEIRYFDLHTTGFGYLNRVREMVPERGKPYVACDISALYGPSNKASSVKFDVTVPSADAKHLILRCKDAVDAEKKVLIGFRLGDLTPSIYTRTRGKYAGEQAVSLRVHLLRVTWIKVDGELVYKEEPKSTPAGPRESEVTQTSAAPAVQGKPAAAAESFNETDDVTDVEIIKPFANASRKAPAESLDEDISF